MSTAIDLLAPDVLADPYPAFAELRADGRAVWSDVHGAWLIARYQDVHRSFRDHEHFSSDRISPVLERARGRDASLEAVLEVLSLWMVFQDPPDHGRLRKLVHLAFTPRTIADMHGRMQAIVDELIDELPPAGAFDLVADFAFPLPAIVIAELLGVPAADRERFKGWSDDLQPLLFGGTQDQDRRARAEHGVGEFIEYIRELIDFRRRHRRTGTLVDELVQANENGDQLSDAELEATCLLLLFAGHETTTNLITNSVYTLLCHPQARRRVTDEPASVSGAIEETLRFEGPAKAIQRWVRVDHEIDGRLLRRDDRVYLLMGSANRDPDRFTDPDRFDLDRDANHHLGFGHGPHFCLGASMARAETRIAVGSLLRRRPGLALTSGEPAWRPQLLSRGLERLPLSC